MILEESEAMRFPTRVALLAIASHKATRYVSLGGFAGEGLLASCGLVAGCSLATTVVKVVALCPVDKAAHLIPHKAALDPFIGGWHAMGHRALVCSSIMLTCRLPRSIIAQILGRSVAEDKAAVVASDKELLEALRAAVGPLARPANTVANTLGADYSAGRHRACAGRRTVRAKRIRTQQRRVKQGFNK